MWCFISYKSEDANLVRGVAERLLAKGIDLWFAEYRVLPENYEDWQVAIDEGLSQASHALVFSNKRWTGSEPCRYEMRKILERIDDPTKIIEVCIPKEDEPHLEFPELAAGDAIVFRGDSRKPVDEEVEELVAEISARLDLPSIATGFPISNSKTISFERYGIKLDLGPLQPALGKTLLAQRTDGRYSRSVTFAGKIADIDVSLDIYIWPFDSILRHYSISQNRAANDREVYTSYRKYARQWLEEESQRRFSKLRSRGLHLVFIGDHSHLGLTYTSKELSVRESIWERRYAIMLQDQGSGLLGEMGLIFAASLEGPVRQQLQQFCRVAPQLDTIARSLTIRIPSFPNRVLNSVFFFLGRGIYTAVSIGLLATLVVTSTPNLVLLALAIPAGYFGADLLLMASRPLYRNLLQTLRPLSDELVGPSPIERFSDDLFHQLTSIPTLLIGDLINGIRDLFKKPLRILIVAALSFLVCPVWWWICRGRELPLSTVLIPFGATLGALLKVSSVVDWISSKSAKR